jgi:hypothetical protein
VVEGSKRRPEGHVSDRTLECIDMPNSAQKVRPNNSQSDNFWLVTLEIILRDSLVDILRAATSSAPDEVLPL